MRVGINALERRNNFLRPFHFFSGVFARHQNDFVTLPENKKSGRARPGLAVQKSYFFVTRAKTERAEFEYSSYIEKQGDRFVSLNKSPNSFTHFEKINSYKDFELWKALPRSGKPHQIRLHAQSLNIPILGDHLHGGAHFSRMMLHSHSLKFSIEHEKLEFASPLPYLFENLQILQNSELAQWLCGIERRFWWLKNAQLLSAQQFLKQNNTWRWLHTETKHLRAEQLGDNVFFNWYDDKPPSASQIENIEFLYEFLKGKLQQLEINTDNLKFFIQLRSERQKAPGGFGELKSSPHYPKRWQIKENNLNYELRIDSGLSTGLFLDQRNNRKWILQNSQRLRVLNLFSYTGGFSICAARGGAVQVVSVDVSANFLEWSKTNFSLNSLETNPHEFRKIDSLEYLAWAKKKEIRFDLIVCDPPSFARIDKKIFKIEKSLPELMSLLISILNPSGKILFCSNFEEMNSKEFLKALKAATTALDVGPEEFKILREDFEMPHQEALMKSFLIQKLERPQSNMTR